MLSWRPAMASSSTHLARLRLALPPVLRPVLPLVLAWFGLSASLAGCEVIAGITDRRVGDGGAPEVAPMPDGANGAAGGSADATAGTGGVTPLGGAGGGGGSPD